MYFYIVKFRPMKGFVYDIHQAPFNQFINTINKNDIIARVFETPNYLITFDEYKMAAVGNIMGPMSNGDDDSDSDEASDDGAGGEIERCKELADFNFTNDNIYDWHTTNSHYKINENNKRDVQVETKEVRVKRVRLL